MALRFDPHASCGSHPNSSGRAQRTSIGGMGWRLLTSFATVLPTAEDLALVERLDAAIAGDAHLAVDADSQGLIDALGQIYGWATGMRLAYGTPRLDGARLNERSRQPSIGRLS
jgi:hypothetical protein